VLKGPRVAVIGAGIVGASVAWHLAGRGARVVVLERAAGPATGATGRSAAGLRHQFSLDVNVRFSLYSAERYRRFRSEVGDRSGFVSVGYTFLVPPDAEAAWRDQGRAVRAAGARVAWLTPDELEQRWPYVSADGLAGGSFGPDDGVLDPHGVTMGYLRGARAVGAEIRFDAPVTALAPRGAGARIVAGGSTIDADVVVNAAGPQAGAVAALADVALPVVPSRRCVYVTGPLPRLPRPTPLLIDLATGVWLRSEGERAIFGRSNPDEVPGEHDAVDWDWLEATLEVALPRFPFLGEAALDRRACWVGHYEMTPDHLPALGRDASAPWLVHAAGFSGHGVQHAPATGTAVADLVFDGASTRFDLSPFDPARFAEGGLQRREGLRPEGAIV
jgi:sarcosine oxidase, subunit beta